ncbi:hypothetical protein AB0O91_32845 [Kitasatospora sp. NPDC089797]|uniref:hypothetical protein n=1 Tax=Kitasatospora sp. NPDC089797 TaxID=3155298 RepID=UPI0034312394
MKYYELPGPAAGSQDRQGEPVTPKEQGERGTPKKKDAPWPRRPLLVALWVPAAAVLLPAGGALGALGGWFLLPALAASLAAAVGLIYALVCLCQSAVLRSLALVLLVAPLVAVPLLSANAVQSTVLSLRGTTHRGTVTDITVSHGRTTSYTCSVRYADDPGRTGSVQCGSSDTTGEQVDVTEDPQGLVQPEFSASAGDPHFDLTVTGLTDLALFTGSAVAVSLGALLHLRRGRRNPVAPAPG